MKSYLSLIKFSHTVFALPFAAVGAVLAFKDGYALDWLLGLKILLCMVFARSAAMAFNRWADERYDRLNPRTAGREIPAGRVTSHEALWMTLLSSLAFVVTAWSINSICFYLSPLALLTILGYSYTKRWTAICHLILGGGLALAPIGSYLAVTGIFSLIPLLYSGVVFYWVSGFDIIYALQDEEFDKVHRLHSIPARFGKSKALKISRLLHFISAMILFFASWLIHNRYESSGVWLWLSALVFVSMLIYQQNLVKPGDLSKINLAFFTTNGLASVIYGVLFSMDLLF